MSDKYNVVEKTKFNNNKVGGENEAIFNHVMFSKKFGTTQEEIVS
jgi:hypothetical protein